MASWVVAGFALQRHGGSSDEAAMGLAQRWDAPGDPQAEERTTPGAVVQAQAERDAAAAAFLKRASLPAIRPLPGAGSLRR